jgi:hypothetical protein
VFLLDPTAAQVARRVTVARAALRGRDDEPAAPASAVLSEDDRAGS